MKTDTEFKLEYNSVAECSDGAAVIVVAAGSSSRMKGVNKIFSGLLGVPVIARTLRAFERCDIVKKIIIVTRAEDINQMQNVAENYLITKVTDIVEGGADRFSSVMNGIKMLSSEDTYVLVHDGARPLVSDRVIKDVYSAVLEHGAATCAVPLKDTVKFIGDDGFGISTPDRSTLCAVQTPQGFVKELYLECVKNTDNTSFTDDSSVFEAAGKKVFITKGDYNNIKITTPEDIIVAEAILKNGGDEL